MDFTHPIFTDADKPREHLERLNWPNDPVCPHCGERENVTRLAGKSHRPGLIQCNACTKNFTITNSTVFERSKIALNKWVLATYLLSSSKKGMNAHQLHRMLGVTYKTASFMCHRIREAMKGGGSDGPLGARLRPMKPMLAARPAAAPRASLLPRKRLLRWSRVTAICAASTLPM